MLTIKYNRKDFFGSMVYVEDVKRSPGKSDVKKVLAFFGKNHDVAIEINDIVIFWDTLSEYENRIATVRIYDSNRNCTEVKKSFESAKKEVYAMHNTMVS